MTKEDRQIISFIFKTLRNGSKLFGSIWDKDFSVEYKGDNQYEINHHHGTTTYAPKDLSCVLILMIKDSWVFVDKDGRILKDTTIKKITEGR